MQLATSDALGRATGPAFAQHHLLALAAAGAADGPLHDANGAWLKAEAVAVVDRLAAAFDRALPGDGPGRAVALILGDDRRCIAAIRACWRCGDDVICLRPDWAPEVIAEALRAADADLVVTDDPAFRWPEAPVLVLPSADALLSLPPSSSQQRPLWHDQAAARRAAS